MHTVRRRRLDVRARAYTAGTGRSSAWSERRLWEAESVGSNPTVPTDVSEEPVAVPQDRHGLAVPGDAVDLELVRADHEVGVDRGVVDAAGDALLRLELARPGDGLQDRRAERDVRRGVLVE